MSISDGIHLISESTLAMDEKNMLFSDIIKGENVLQFAKSWLPETLMSIDM